MDESTTNPNPMNDSDILHVLMFSIPLRKPTVKTGVNNYIELFKNSAKTVESHQLVEQLQQTRLIMEDKISLKTPIWDDICTAIERYLPYLFTITWSLTQQTKPVEISKNPTFEWKGSYTASETASSFVEFSFEIIMCLHTLVSPIALIVT